MYAAPMSYDIYAAATPAAGGSTPNLAWKDGSSFSFHDVLDTLNPLQHLPLIGTLYRWITGDEPGDVARMVGDGIYGGPIGFVTGAVSAAVRDETGKDPGEMVMALVSGEDSTPAKVAGTGAPAKVAGTGAPAKPAHASAPAAAASAPTASAPAPAAAAVAAAATPPAAAAATPGTIFASRGSFIPLFQSAPPAAATGAAEQGRPTQNAALQRSLHGERAMPPRPITAPVPLQLTGPELPQNFLRMPISARAARPAAAAPAASPSAAPQPAAAAADLPDLAALPQNATVDIPQRMMDALDKYARMQQMQQRGQAVDGSH